MTGSMYASVAGLRAHMQKLTVIGHNVANVNTQGYKKQRTVFRDSVYSMYSGGSNGTSTVGGKNPSQLGYGSMVGSIDLNMSSSSYNPGNPMDCALAGDGFFLVGTKDVENAVNPAEYNDFNSESLKALTLTRVGDFKFGADNYLVDGKGNVVYGFMATSDTKMVPDPATGELIEEHVISQQLVPIRLPRWDPENEYAIKYARTDVVVTKDANGKITGGTLKEGTAPAQRLEDDRPIFNVAGEGEGAGEDENAVSPDDQYEFAQFSSISIDAGTGAITGISKATDELVTIGYLAIGNVTNPNGVTHIGNSYYKCQEGAGALSVSMLGGVQKDLWADGTDRAVYVNGDRVPTGEPADGENAIEPKPGTEVTGSGKTEMLVGFLEAPNTDLAEEITELITTQRGYQANTRIITVTDSMLEELVNMKR